MHLLHTMKCYHDNVILCNFAKKAFYFDQEETTVIHSSCADVPGSIRGRGPYAILFSMFSTCQPCFRVDMLSVTYKEWFLYPTTGSG